jgi:glycyl-tRNA synthetase beta chain
MREKLLIEIGVEELPAIPLLTIVKEIEKSWQKLLDEFRLKSEFEFIYTPRRLVLKHEAMPLKQEESTTELFGPPLQVALKDGEPTGAGLGFAKKCGVAFEALERVEQKGREVLYFKKEEKGQETKLLLATMLQRWVTGMAFGKMMRWASRSDEFIRPIRWLQVRLGSESIDVELFGVTSATHTYVHRMKNFQPVEVSNIEAYEPLLNEGGVVLYPHLRETRILEQFDALEAQHNITIERDKALLAEVVAITEYPTALLGNFDETFLTLPPEVIVTSMKEHQRYFAVYDGDTLTNKFIVVSNAITDDYSKVIAGNERVLKPRLADALFFYNNDLKHGLTTQGLEKIQFMDGLGSLNDKLLREEQIAQMFIGKYILKLERETQKCANEIKTLMQRSIELAKADLLSEMVYEFTELQGLMGYYYAKALGEDALVYTAIKEQYMPVGEGAELPHSLFSSIVAMSIKLDTLIGLFSVGKIPTGSKDPFALRRAVNGLLRIVVENDISFEIDTIINTLKSNYTEFDTNILEEFILERLYKSFNANASVISAVLNSGERDMNKISKKVEALNTIVNSPTFKEQFSTFKRVANISKDINVEQLSNIDVTLFEESAEQALFEAYEKVVATRYTNYTQKLEALFGLKPLLDNYFNDVMVNSDKESLKTNRLNTIGAIYKSFKEIADIKEISI